MRVSFDMDVRNLLVAPCMLAGFIAATLILCLGTAMPHSDQLAAIFPPWWTPAQTFEAAARAGRLIARGQMPGSVIVRGDAATLAGRLRATGALLIIDPTLLVGCQAAIPETAQ